MAKAMRVIRVPKIDRDIFYAKAEEAVREVIDGAAEMFDLTVKDFNTKPEFDRVYKRDSRRIVGEVFTTDMVYRFLDEGTRVRYAVMTPDFISKTRPSVLPSRRGRGGLMKVIKSNPLPGIEARNFDERIAQRMQPRFNRIARQKLMEAARESGHQIT